MRHTDQVLHAIDDLFEGYTQLILPYSLIKSITGIHVTKWRMLVIAASQEDYFITIGDSGIVVVASEWVEIEEEVE